MSFNNNYNTGRQITPVVRDLLIINVLFFIGTRFSEDVAGLLALYYPASANFKPFQIVTHFFMHADIMHLVLNMLGLFSIGVMLEMVWGGKRFLIYYLVCAFGAAFIHLIAVYLNMEQMHASIEAIRTGGTWENVREAMMAIFNNSEAVNKMLDSQVGPIAPDEIESVYNNINDLTKYRLDVPMVGASGAIYGLLAAVWFLFPDTAFYMYFIPVPIKARYLIPILLVSDLFFGFSRFGGDNVAHFAHVGGAFVGAVMMTVWYKGSIWKK